MAGRPDRNGRMLTDETFSASGRTWWRTVPKKVPGSRGRKTAARRSLFGRCRASIFPQPADTTADLLFGKAVEADTAEMLLDASDNLDVVDLPNVAFRLTAGLLGVRTCGRYEP